MGRWLRWIGIAIGTLVALVIGIPAIVVGVLVLFYDWNAARPFLGRLASTAVGREVAITGPLDVDFGRVTRIHMQGLSVANATWGKAPYLLRMGDLDVSVALWPLLSGDVVIPSLRLANVDAALERMADGRANWQFGSGAPTRAEPARASQSTRLPLIESLDNSDTRVDLDDRRLNKQAALAVDHLRLGEDKERRQMTAEGTGSYQGRPASLKAVMGSLTVLQEGKEPYPLDVALAAGDFQAHVDGTMAKPLALEGLNLQLDIRGDDMSNLFPLTGIPVPPTPPYRLTGRLERSGPAWVFKQFAGRLGESDMRGTVSATLGGARPRIEGDVVSNLLDLKDLGGFIGASEGGAEARTAIPRPDGRILPDKEIDLSKLRAVDAEIAFKGTRIVTPQVPIDRLDAKVSLEDGTFRAQPVSFAIGKGTVKVFFSLYGAEQPVRSDTEAVIQQVDLKRLLQGSDFVRETAGSFNGRIKLAASGTSVAQIAGSATGDVMVVLTDGRFSQLLVELAGLDIAESLGFLIEGDRSIPVRCIVADLGANQGVFDVRTLVFDTTDTNIIGDGRIDMRDEKLDLRLRPAPKDFSPLTLRAPISVQGMLGAPDAFPDPADIGVDNIPKKILDGIVTVVTGLLPPLDIGPGKDAPCAALIQQARQRLSGDTGRTTRRQ